MKPLTKQLMSYSNKAGMINRDRDYVNIGSVHAT